MVFPETVMELEPYSGQAEINHTVYRKSVYSWFRKFEICVCLCHRLSV